QVLEEVIVTAQGREQSLQEVPVAVSVLGGMQLEQQSLLTLMDVATRIGNVKINYGSLTNAINVRGVGSGQNPGFEQAVATFADGIYRSRSRTTGAALFDVDRVEILKGPQTTFFGANASAGALNITTRKPGREFEGNLNALYEFEHGEYNLEGGVSMPLTETLSARLALRANGMDGYVDLPHGDGPDEEAYQGRLSLHFAPNEVWTSDLRIDYARSRIDNITPWQLTDCPPPAGFPMSPVCGMILAANPGIEDKPDDRSMAPDGTTQDFDFVEIAFTNAFDLGPGVLRSITGYSNMDVDQRTSLVPATYPQAVGGYDPFPTANRENYEFFSQELRFESETGGRFEYLAGIYYSTAEFRYQTIAGFFFLPFGFITEDALGVDFPDIDPTTPITGVPLMSQDETTRAVFASGTLNVTDALRVSVGARYTEVKKSAHRSLTVGTSVNGYWESYVPYPDDRFPSTMLPFPVSRTQAICLIIGCFTGDFERTSRKDSKFMPSVNVQYDLTETIMAYASYSKGFKAGGFSATSTPSVFGPEEVDAYEIGLKSRLLDNSLELNLALFYMEYEGLQETTFDANLASHITNVAGSTSQGVELGLTWIASEYFTVTADVGFLDATYEDYPNGECTKAQLVADPSCVADLDGKQRAYAPDWSGSISAHLIVPMGPNELRITPTLSYSDSFFLLATADPLFEQDSFTKIDLRIGYGPADRSWEVAILGRNLGDEITVSNWLGVPGGDGSGTALVERGRSVAVQFMRNF
ncbi:MAG: TonB-dependent receptor, partial [Spongiibacteraceae bacterium]|nr:TonB-dependent receptor [Spongiibacteraceae bacterium]